MEAIREELLHGEDKLLQRIHEAWESRYEKQLEELTLKYAQCEETSSEEARTVLREAVDLKAQVKAEFELLQELRSEIEDSESAFDWKARFERLDKENLHLREKMEDFKQQVSELERSRKAKEFEINNQRRYYDNRVEELERQLRVSATSTFSPSLASQFSTPMADRVRQYTALTVISDDEEDDVHIVSPPPAPPKSPGRSLPATPLSASSPKPRRRVEREEAEEMVPRAELRRVEEELQTARAEVARLRAEAESRGPELTASLERLKEELCMVDDASQTERLFPDEMSYSGLLNPATPRRHDASTSAGDSLGFSFSSPGRSPNANGPLFPLETLAGVIVEASLNNAVNTMRQVEEAVARERANAKKQARADAASPDDNRLAEQADGRQRVLQEKFAACRPRLWQKVKKDSVLRQDIEDIEAMLGLKPIEEAGDRSMESMNGSLEHMNESKSKKERRSWLTIQWLLGHRRRSNKNTSTPPSSARRGSGDRARLSQTCLSDSFVNVSGDQEAETQTVCLACTDLQAAVSEAEGKRVELLSRISMLEEELVETRRAGEEGKKRESELEQHITKLRNLSVKDNEEIDSLIGELDALRQLFDTKQTEFQARVEAMNRSNEGRLEQMRLECHRKVEEMKTMKDEEMQTALKNNISSQGVISNHHEEEVERLQREHAQEVDMLDQKYQDEFVDLERHHTDAGVQTEVSDVKEEMLALKKDLEERFNRDMSRVMEDNAKEVTSLRDRLQEARNASESFERSPSDPSESQQNEHIAIQLMNQLIQYCSALEVKLNNVCFEEELAKNSKASITKRLPSFPLRCSAELQPALTESLEVLTELVNRVLSSLDSAHQRSERLQRRVDSLDRNLDQCGTAAEQEHQDLEDLRTGYQGQAQELQRAEALIRTYAEKEGELTKRLEELHTLCNRVNGELESTKEELEHYRKKESAIDEERSQLQSVRDLLSNSMNDSSRARREEDDMKTGSGKILKDVGLNIIEKFHGTVVENLALFEANQSLQDEKSQLESEFGRRFEQLQARKAELEGQVETMEVEMDRRDESYKAREEDLEAQMEAMRKQMRSDAKFLEEQTREREAERDKFQNELEQLEQRVREVVRENSSLRDQLAAVAPSGSPGSPMSPAPGGSDDKLRERLRQMEQDLEEEQSTSDQLREQIDELMAENARLQVDLLQRRGSSSPEASDEDDALDDRASTDSLEADQVLKPRRSRPNSRQARQQVAQQVADLDEELVRTKFMRELEGRLSRRRSEDAEARLEDAEVELTRMRHIHEESENDKKELQQQVCTQLGQLSALRQEVDSKRHIPQSAPVPAADTSDRVEELEAELSQVRGLLESRTEEASRLEESLKAVLVEKENTDKENEKMRARVHAAEAVSSEVDALAMSEFTQRLLGEKNEEIDALQARLDHLEQTNFRDGERLDSAQDDVHRLHSRLDERDEAIRKVYDGMKQLKGKLEGLVRSGSAADVLRVSANGDGPDQSSSEEEVCELNIPGSMEEETEPTEVMVRQKKSGRVRLADPKWALTGVLDEVETMVDELRLELQRRDDEVEALRVHESTLEKEVKNLITFQRELQEDYDIVQNMLEESQQLRKELEEYDPHVIKAEFEEREATLSKALKEAQCLANEREEDLYVLREEKEQVEASLAEVMAESSAAREEAQEKSDTIERLEAEVKELQAAVQRAQEAQEALKAERAKEAQEALEAERVREAEEAQERPVDEEAVLPASAESQRAGRRSEVCDAAAGTDWDSGLNFSVAFTNTPPPAAPDLERWQRELEASRTEVRSLGEQLSRSEAARDRAQREAGIERSERERLASEKERLQRELRNAQEEVNCQRVRLHALLHGAEDELEDALSSLPSSLSPRRSPLEEEEHAPGDFCPEEVDEELLMVHRARQAARARGSGDEGRLPHQLQALLDRIHKEGVQLLSLSELQYLQTHATVIRHKLDAIRKESGLKCHADATLSDPVINELQCAWRQEKEALQSANESLKDLLSQLGQPNGLVSGLSPTPGLCPDHFHSPPRNRNNNSVSPMEEADWRQEMISTVERAYKEERQALLAHMRSEVTAAMSASPQPPFSGLASPEKRLRQLESRLQAAEIQQRGSLERLYQADRHSLLEENRGLRRRLHLAEQELKAVQDKQMALSASEMNARHENSLRESELAGQLERLKTAFSNLHLELEAANRRLGENEERVLELNAERNGAVKRACELERQVEEKETRICLLAEQLQQETRRRQDCINLADEEQQLHDRLRTQLDSERSRSARLETELKEERNRSIDRARQSAVNEQELRCQLEAEHRRCSDLEASLETERLRYNSVQRELEGERSLRRNRDGETESRNVELSTMLEMERARIEELKGQLERERRQHRQTREALEEERSNRRQAAHVDADTQAGLTSQLEASRARVHQLQAALDAERNRLRKLTPRAEEVANALERERAVTARMQAELAQAKASRLEAETRADRLQDCLRGLSEEHEAERRRWREQERRCSLELEEVSSRLHHSADVAHHTSSRLTSTLRSSSASRSHLRPNPLEHKRGRSAELTIGSPSNHVLGVAPHHAEDGDGAELAAVLVAAENQVDVLRCADPDRAEELGALGRQLRAVRQRLEAGGGGAGMSDHVIRQNCELSRMVARLAREKEELRQALCRLEEEVGNFRTCGGDGSAVPDESLRVPPDGRGPNGNGVGREAPTSPPRASPLTGTPTPSEGSEVNRSQRIYAKYLRSESKRRALVYQKRYLLLLLGGFRECEEAVLATIAGMGVRLSSGASSAASLHFRIPRPLMRFRAAVRVVVATHRMKAMVQRWATALEERPGSSCTNGRAKENSASRVAGLSAIPSSSGVSPRGSSSRPHSSPNLSSLRPFQADPSRWRASPGLSPSTSRNEDFLRRLERLQYRVETFASSPPPPTHATPGRALPSSSTFSRYGPTLVRADLSPAVANDVRSQSLSKLHPRYSSVR